MKVLLLDVSRKGRRDGVVEVVGGGFLWDKNIAGTCKFAKTILVVVPSYRSMYGSLNIFSDIRCPAQD